MGNSKTAVPEKFNPEKEISPDVRIFNALIFNEKGEILLLKRSEDDRYFPGHYNILSGKLEDKEGYIEGLMREVKEEIGVEISSSNIIEQQGFEFTRWKGIIWKMQPFRILFSGAEMVLNEEHLRYVWIKPEEVDGLELTPQVMDMIERFS